MRTTQLARVQTPTPQLLLLTNANANANANSNDGANVNANANAVRVVVQVRPALLHYVQDGVLMCVITSKEEICAITQYDMSSPMYILVATMSGSVWRVRLPSRPMGVKPLVLRASIDNSPASDAAVRRIAEVHGAQCLVYLAHLDLLVCSSLLVPTTVIGDVLHGPQQWRFEIDDFEGERSTCLRVFTKADHPRLASWLLDDVPGSSEMITLILQGDADGTVRCAVVKGSSQVVQRVTELTRLQEPIHCMLPIRLVKGAGADALLVVGALGSVVLLSLGLTRPRILFGRLGTPVTSVAFLDDAAKDPTIAVVTTAQKISTLSIAQLLTQLHVDANASRESQPLASVATEMSQFQDVLTVCAHMHDTIKLSLLTRSGRLISLQRDDISQSLTSSTPRKNEVDPTDLRVKTLLQNISRLSDKTDQLRKTSEHADALLFGLNTALQLIRHVEARGIDCVVSCAARLKLVDDGWAMQSKGVRLLFTFGFTELLSADHFMPAATWRLQFTVGTSTSDRVCSYGFSLQECIGLERCIQLDESVLQQQDGVVQVSCELVFNPCIAEAERLQLASFGIPVLQAHEFHLVQLSEPTREFPMNPAAIRERFTTAHLSKRRGPAKQGHEWWATLFETASAAGIVLSTCDVGDLNEAASPPLRVVTRIAMQRADSDKELLTTEEEMLTLLFQLMNVEGDVERKRWRAAWRHVNGKWWIGMHTFSSNLIVLRFATTTVTSTMSQNDSTETTTEDYVEITAHASNAADLAAMRALLLHTCVTYNETKNTTKWKKQDVEHASDALMKTRTELDKLAASISDIYEKTTSASISGQRDDGQEIVDMCQDEMLQLLQRTAQVETRTLEMYWRVREVQSQYLTL